MLRFTKFLAASAAALALLGAAEARDRYGCSSSGDRTASTLVGAVIGGVIGGQFGNDGDDRAIGAVAGALLGGAVGNSAAGGRDCGRDAFSDAGYDDGYYDDGRYDQAYDDYYEEDPYAQDAYYDAFENADPYDRVSWNNAQGYSNYVEARDWYSDDAGRDCREFEQEIYINGRPQTAIGTACRDDDGTWRIVD
jgi:surface antigen